MAISTYTFSPPLEGLRPCIEELARGLHLRVNVTVGSPLFDHLTCCQKVTLTLIIDVTFFARLLEGLGRAGAANGFTVLQCLKKGDDIISRPDPTSTSLWEQVEAQTTKGGPGITMLELQQAI